MGRDEWAVAAIALLLVVILQQAILGNRLREAKAELGWMQDAANENGGWVFIGKRK